MRSWSVPSPRFDVYLRTMCAMYGSPPGLFVGMLAGQLFRPRNEHEPCPHFTPGEGVTYCSTCRRKVAVIDRITLTDLKRAGLYLANTNPWGKWPSRDA